MTSRWEQEDLDAKLAENSELAVINQKINGSTLFGKKVKVDTRGSPLPAFAKAIQHQKQRSNQEEEFLEKLITLAHLHHWICAHFRPARVIKNGKVTYRTAVSADGRGFPDLVLVRDRVIFIEVKSWKGKLSPAQAQWQEWLKSAGQETYIFRINDWETAVEVLS